jgi:cell cycle sensor histidine kinase DivJ
MIRGSGGSGVLRPEWFAQAFGALSDRLAPVSATRDRRMQHAYVRFICARVLFAGILCLILPPYVLATGRFGPLEATGVCAILVTLLPVVHVSRTGRLDQGQDAASLLSCALVTVLSLQSGGIWSYGLFLFVIVLLDVAATGGKRSVWRGAAMAVGGILLVAVLPTLGPQSALSVHVVGLVLVCYALVIAWVMVDRNERHASAQMRSQARAQAALESVADAVIWREGDGGFSYANGGAYTMLGIDRRVMSEQTLLERVNVGDRPAFLKALSDAASGRGAGAAQLRIGVEHDGDRSVRLFEMAARRVEVAGRENAVVLVLRDITERQAADEMRESARRDAERAASAKGQFLATMSHELRTPLNAIIGFSELLMQQDLIPANDPRRDEYARIINSSGQHLLEVVNAILDMSKIESGMMAVEQERVELAAVVRSSAEFLAVKAQAKDVVITPDIAADLPEIVSDRRALKQILLNLMSNAVKFSAGGGEIAITAVRDRDHVEIAVSDTGVGIAEADLAQIGSAFFQARQSYDREHEGTGLGLSVVRGLVGLLGGAMTMESAPGEGTRVAIRLPIAGAAQGAEPVSITTRVRARRAALAPLFQTPADGDAAASRRIA